MDEMLIKRFEQPDDTATFEKGRFETITVGGMTLGMATYQPGWKWSEHIGAQSGKKWCSTEHVGVVLKGVAAVSFPDGTVGEMRKGDAFYITGEHDSWVIGEEPYVSLHVAGAKEYKPRN